MGLTDLAAICLHCTVMGKRADAIFSSTSLFLVVSISVINPNDVALAVPETTKIFYFNFAFVR